MFTKKQVSAKGVAVGLLPCLIYSSIALADCANEIPKLKAAANSYKAAIQGQAVLPDEIKSLLRERYDPPFDATSTPFAKQMCIKTDLSNRNMGGWERLCKRYQTIINTLLAWYKSASPIKKDAHDKYRAWNQAWVGTRADCLGRDYPDKELKAKLKKAGIVPSQQDL